MRARLSFLRTGGLVAGGLSCGLAANSTSSSAAAASASTPGDEMTATLLDRIERLERRCSTLEQKLRERDDEQLRCAPREAVGHIVDGYVEWWYAKNKHDVDAGVVEFLGTKIDLFPDSIEKHMYSTMFKAMVNQILDTEMSVAGVRMRMEPIEPFKKFEAPRSMPSSRGA